MWWLLLWLFGVEDVTEDTLDDEDVEDADDDCDDVDDADDFMAMSMGKPLLFVLMALMWLGLPLESNWMACGGMKNGAG